MRNKSKYSRNRYSCQEKKVRSCLKLRRKIRQKNPLGFEKSLKFLSKNGEKEKILIGSKKYLNIYYLSIPL